MNLEGAFMLFVGALMAGVFFGFLLSLLIWRSESSYGRALRIGLMLGFVFAGATYVGLVILGLYENWARAQ